MVRSIVNQEKYRICSSYIKFFNLASQLSCAAAVQHIECYIYNKSNFIVSANDKLFAATVLANYIFWNSSSKLFAATVLANYKLFLGTVPANYR